MTAKNAKKKIGFLTFVFYAHAGFPLVTFFAVTPVPFSSSIESAKQFFSSSRIRAFRSRQCVFRLDQLSDFLPRLRRAQIMVLFDR